MLLRALLLRTVAAQATDLAWLIVPMIIGTPWLARPARADLQDAHLALATATATITASDTARPWVDQTRQSRDAPWLDKADTTWRPLHWPFGPWVPRC